MNFDEAFIKLCEMVQGNAHYVVKSRDHEILTSNFENACYVNFSSDIFNMSDRLYHYTCLSELAAKYRMVPDYKPRIYSFYIKNNELYYDYQNDNFSEDDIQHVIDAAETAIADVFRKVEKRKTEQMIARIKAL